MKIKSIKPNMTEVTMTGKRVLVSYETPVAIHVDGRFLVTNTKFSRTTSRHIKTWLEGESAEGVDQEVIESFLK